MKLAIERSCCTGLAYVRAAIDSDDKSTAVEVSGQFTCLL